jgi:hypothetical protein
MRLKTICLTAAIFLAVPFQSALAEIQIPDSATITTDDATLKELEVFYDEIEKALADEDINKLMSFYAEDYLHRGITKVQLRFMWLEIFNTYQELYSIHAFSRIHVNGPDAILGCSGALLGVKKAGEDYAAVDRWVDTNHWVTKVNGEWKMVGGASHKGSTFKKSDDTHPLF